jgi:serine protease Do
VIGVDKDTDLAVIKIDVGHSLPTVKLGNSEGTQVGDWVEAIGSPFDLNETVTAGIISAKDRNIEGGAAGQFKHYIQTDAAINPGNSGGPLLDMDGEVIGVNTAIFSSGGGMGGEAGNMGIGFAMPSNTVIDVYNQLIGPEHKVIRGSIGISFQPQISTAVAKMYGASDGVLISAVTPGMPADKAGLKANDVIVSVDGKPIKTGDDLVGNITPRHPGTTVTIGYLRNGQKMTATVGIADRTATVDALNGGAVPNGPNANASPSAAQTKLGLTVTDLPQGAPSKIHGVLIRSVKPGSFADELNPGLQPGLIIEAVNRKSVNNKAEFDAIVSSLKSGDDVVFEITAPNQPGSSLVGGTLP